MTDPVILEVVVAARADAVWRALREPSEIRRWFGWDHEEIDEEIRIIFFQESQADDAARVLDTGEGGAIALEDRGDVTVVRVTRAAPAGREGWEGIYDEVNEGWISFLQQLRFSLERHPGRDRSTVHIATSGERWFRSEHQSGEVTEDGALVIRTPKRVIVSRYA